MGIKTNRIEAEFIVKSVIKKNIPVIIHLHRKTVNSLPIDYTLDKTLTLTIQPEDKDLFSKEQKITCYFSYFKNVMTFQSEVLSLNENSLLISYPDSLYRNLNRKYERISLNSNPKYSIEFFIKKKKFEFSFPVTDEYNDDFSYSKAEIGDLTSGIRSVVDDMKNKMKDSVSEIDIITFKNRNYENFDENLIISFGKILYIKSISEPFSDSDRDDIITKPLLDKFYHKKWENRFNKMIFEKGIAEITSEADIPIIYHSCILGYIRLRNTHERIFPIPEENIKYAAQVAKILALAFKESGYCGKEIEVTEKIDTKIIDISTSGLMFKHKSKELDSIFALYTDFKLTLFAEDLSIPVKARVMRKYSDKNYSYYGVAFLDISDENIGKLFPILYGKQMSEEDETKFEGGAEIPDLAL